MDFVGFPVVPNEHQIDVFGRDDRIGKLVPRVVIILYMSKLTRKLVKLLKRSLIKGDFVLTSGKVSNYYLNGRNVTLHPEGAFLSSHLFFEVIKKNKITAVGGPTLGADPLVGAIAYIAYAKKYRLKTFIVRKAPKSHADKKQIEGPKLNKKDIVLIIDDTATTGKSLIDSAKILRNLGLRVAKALVLVDREEGARENLNKIGIELKSIFTLRDLL
ncbi:MAG: orotate phosphoribosyltransferase [Candidatus Yanofskybacteria bacterium]|nr:orotate phosphoribosyltransferase [Candidatus Yanofskybacteria bacterium]